MKLIRNYKSLKYTNKEYTEVSNEIYMKIDSNEKSLYVTSLCFIQEPEYDEGSDASNISQNPLEDILEDYNVYISDFYEHLNVKKSKVCYLEFCSEDIEDVKNVRKIIGKHIYNIIDDQGYSKLLIEDDILESDFENNTNNVDFIISEERKILKKNIFINNLKKSHPLFNIQMMNFIFSIIFLIVVFLHHFRFINITKSILPFYIIPLFIFFLIFLLMCIICMNKNKKEEKMYLKEMFFILISILFLGLLSGLVDKKNDIERFMVNAKKTIGTIINIDKSIRRSIKDDEETFIVTYKYLVEYYASDKKYYMTFKENDSFSYESRANNSVSNYETYDKITLYYNINNPSDTRINTNVASNNFIYSLAFAIFIIQVYSILNTILYLKKNK